MQLGLLLGFVVSLITLVWSGVELEFAKGNKVKNTRIKRILKWLLVGVVATLISAILFFLSFALVVREVALQ
jgi:Na+/H+ antiporter NhaC